MSVSGFAPIGYTLSVSAGSFVNADVGSPTPLMPPSVMEHAMSGDATLPWTPLVAGSQDLAAGTGAHGRWSRTYSFDERIEAPWTNEPGQYSAQLVYTVVAN